MGDISTLEGDIMSLVDATAANSSSASPVTYSPRPVLSLTEDTTAAAAVEEEEKENSPASGAAFLTLLRDTLGATLGLGLPNEERNP